MYKRGTGSRRIPALRSPVLRESGIAIGDSKKCDNLIAMENVLYGPYRIPNTRNHLLPSTPLTRRPNAHGPTCVSTAVSHVGAPPEAGLCSRPGWLLLRYSVFGIRYSVDAQEEAASVCVVCRGVNTTIT